MNLAGYYLMSNCENYIKFCLIIRGLLTAPSGIRERPGEKDDNTSEITTGELNPGPVGLCILRIADVLVHDPGHIANGCGFEGTDVVTRNVFAGEAAGMQRRVSATLALCPAAVWRLLRVNEFPKCPMRL